MLKYFRSIFFSLVGIWCLLCLCLRCGMNLSSLQTGKTLGQGNVESSLSYNWSKMPVLFDFNDNELREEDAIGKGTHIEANAQVGLSDRFDLGFQTSLGTTVIGIDGKYRLTKTNESRFAVAVGAGTGLNAGGAFFQIPLYLSFHPNDNIAIYYSPRQIFQQGAYVLEDRLISIRGFNTGILIGSDRFKFAFNGGYFFGNAGQYDFDLYTVGFGLKFKFLKRKKRRFSID